MVNPFSDATHWLLELYNFQNQSYVSIANEILQLKADIPS